MISNNLAVFDELCRRSLMFIDKCFFHSSDLVQFVVRYGVLFGRYKSVIRSNFHFFAARFKFSQSAFLRVVSMLIGEKILFFDERW